MCELSPVTFHGDTIFCIDYQNQPFTPMRPIVENMGLGWASQSQKLNANKKRWTVTNIVTVAQDGNEREMLCLPVRKLPAWLNSINPKKVRAELRPKIELYQAESDDALWNYWVNGRAERPVAENGPLTPSHRAELKAIVDAKLSTYPARVQGKARSEIWTRFNRHFKIAEYAQLPVVLAPEARDYLIEMEVKALKKLPAAASEQKALPAVPSSSASFLSAADIAALEAAGQRVIALSAYVHREIHELHVEILNVLDIRRMPGGRWRAMSSHIWYSLLEAVSVGPESLTRDTVTGREDRNPAYWTLEMLKDMPAA